MNTVVRMEKTMTCRRVLFWAFLTSLSAWAQSAERPALHFEVASVKPSAPDGGVFSLGLQPGGMLTGKNVTVKRLIMYAYSLPENQIVGGPGWINSTPFDLVGKQDAPTAADRESWMRPGGPYRLMLQSLLADRFQLRVSQRYQGFAGLFARHRQRRFAAE